MGLPCKRIDEGCTQERCNAACGSKGKCGINFKWLCCCNEEISVIKKSHIQPNKHWKCLLYHFLAWLFLLSNY